MTRIEAAKLAVGNTIAYRRATNSPKIQYGKIVHITPRGGIKVHGFDEDGLDTGEEWIPYSKVDARVPVA